VDALRSLTRIAAFWLCLGASVTFPALAAADDRPADGTPPIYVGTERVGASAIADHGRLLVPVRGVFEGIGASVEFSWPHFVVVRKGDDVIAAFILDKTHAIIGHQSVDLDVAPMRRDGRVYVPLRVVAEAAGASVTYANHPPAVYIVPATASAASASAEPATEAAVSAEQTQLAAVPDTRRWRIGVAVFTALCGLGCIVLTARRFGPTLFRPVPRRAPKHVRFDSQPPQVEPQPEPKAPEPVVPPSDQVALSSVKATGEARFRTEVVKETQTIHVPIVREELVIEYAGDGGTVIIEGRRLVAGETVRIPLWEERIHVDVTKHVLLTEDIVVAKRLTSGVGPEFAPAGGPAPDFGVAEGSPS